MASIKFSELQKQAATATKDPLSPGVYDAWVAAAKVYTSKAGRQYIRVSYLTHGEEVWVNDNMNILEDNPNSLKVFFMRMEALGVSSSFFDREPTIEQVAAELVGRECQIEVSLEDDTYNGGMRNNVLKVKPARERKSDV